MILPQNPKVVVIDDKYDEVSYLLQTFSKNGVPYIYLDGKDDTLPTTPFIGIRFIILDMNLDGRTDGATGNKLASVLATYLSKIISPETSPLSILLWTKNDEEIIGKIKEYLKLASIDLCDVKNLEKPSKEEMKKLTLEELEEKINKTDINTGMNYLVERENNIDKASSVFTNNFSLICQQNAEERKIDWNSSFVNIMAKLACSYTGEKTLEDSNQKQYLENATSVLNKSYSSFLSNTNSTQIDLVDKNDLSLSTTAEINKSLFLQKIQDDTKIENGKIFISTEDKDLYQSLLKELFIKPEEISHSELIGIIITPSCDLAHKKFLKDGELEWHRILYGIKLKIDNNSYEALFKYSSYTNSIKSSLKKSRLNDPKLETEILKQVRSSKPDIIYTTSPLTDESKEIFIFIFHFGTITTKPIKKDEITFNYMFNEELSSDLQTKLSNHINRLGNSMLE